MKKRLCGLLAAVMMMTLAACGGGEEKTGWTAQDGQDILDSGAFSDELDELDGETACWLYGLDENHVKEGTFVYRSAGATCEEVAVLLFDSAADAEDGVKTLEEYIAVQIEANRDYRPGEIVKLEKKWLEQRGSAVLLVVADDVEAARKAVE